MMNTLFSYTYRDASNYKMPNSVIVAGELTEDDKKRILASLEAGEYFIPEQVDLPAKRFEDENEGDHCFMEAGEGSFDFTDEKPTVDISATELAEKFAAIGPSGWDAARYAIGNASRLMDKAYR